MCGIGGRTIEEAQRRLSYTEFLSWVAFRRLRGSLHTGMRIEYNAGVLASMYANAHSKNGGHRLYDFTPHIKEPPVSLDDAMEQWK